jgi:hypothetical protein
VSERTVNDGASLVRAANQLEANEWPRFLVPPEACHFVCRARTPRVLADGLGLSQVQLFTRYPDGIVVPTATVPRSDFDTSPAVTSLLRSIIQGRDIWRYCENLGDDITNGPDGFTLSAVIAPAAPTRPPPTTATQAVADDGDRALVERDRWRRRRAPSRACAASERMTCA